MVTLGKGKFINLLLAALFIIFPLGVVGRIAIGSGLNILLNDIVVFFVGAIWGIQKLVKKDFRLKNHLLRPVLLFVVVCVLSLAVNMFQFAPSQVFVSSLYILRWIFYALLFFLISDLSKEYKQKIAHGLLIVGVFLALVGLVQYFLYPNLRNLFYAGWDEHLYRLFSSFLDPNFAGGIFVLSFLLAFAKVLKKGQKNIFTIIVCVLSFIALLLTYSRGSFLSFLVGTALLLFLLGKKKILVVMVGLFAMGIFLLPKNLAGEGVALLRTASIFARLETAQNALTIFRDHPVFGVGFNTYRYVQKQYGFITEEQFDESHAASGTDNSFLFILATTGVIGGFFYLFLWYRILAIFRHDPVVVASIAAIFIHALFVNSLFYPWIMEWIWILLAVSRVDRSL